MFDLAEKRLVWIPIRWQGVAGVGEQVATNVEYEIQCQVELLDREALADVFPPPLPDGTTVTGKLTPREQFRALVQDWRGVKNGRVSAPMTDENIDKMIRVPMFLPGFERSYMNAWLGQIEEREKNLSGSSTDGRAEKAPESAPKE